ncbi:hypothetical protein VNO80_06889 [Phaseolus coccineus]|uniref:Uncharacterized protein n=1 Tax=Phaseolus coccineus TaxID=3886 RepID=A0AAN9NN27_PHACN
MYDYVRYSSDSPPFLAIIYRGGWFNYAGADLMRRSEIYYLLLNQKRQKDKQGHRVGEEPLGVSGSMWMKRGESGVLKVASE